MAMKSFELTGKRELAIVDLPMPTPGPGELLVRTRRSALSVGTEVWRYVNGGHYGGEGGRCGYNIVGEVVATGEGVTRFRPGDIAFATQPHAEYFVAPESRAVRVPAGADIEAAAFTYLPTLGLHGLRQAGYTAGERVLVVGLGIVGLLAAQIANAVGARVISLEVDPVRRDIAGRSNIGPIYDPTDPATAVSVAEAFDGGGPDVVIETSQAWSGLTTAIELAAMGTRYAIVGIYRTHPTPEVAHRLMELTFMNRDHFHNQRLAFYGCSNDPADDYPVGVVRWTIARNMEYSADCIARGRTNPSAAITHRFKWHELEEAYRRFADGERDMVGVILDWDA
jgi:threonine dehydrogenase-like Zn-dependent dehydrogenase